jgi:hypothetical protein
MHFIVNYIPYANIINLYLTLQLNLHKTQNDCYVNYLQVNL